MTKTYLIVWLLLFNTEWCVEQGVTGKHCRPVEDSLAFDDGLALVLEFIWVVIFYLSTLK